MPFEYLEFSCAIRGNHAHMRARADAATARSARHHRRRQGRGRGQGPGQGPGPSVGVGMGMGSNSAQFFLNRATRVWCTSGSRPALLPARCVATVGRNRCNSSSLERTIATVQTEPLQPLGLLDGFALQTFPRIAINNAPPHGLKHTESDLSFSSNNTEKRISI